MTEVKGDIDHSIFLFSSLDTAYLTQVEYLDRIPEFNFPAEICFSYFIYLFLKGLVAKTLHEFGYNCQFAPRTYNKKLTP